MPLENKSIKPHVHVPLSAALLKQAGIDPVIDSQYPVNAGHVDGFKCATAIVVMCDFKGQHGAHELNIPVPLHDADIDYFKRMEPLVKDFYQGRRFLPFKYVRLVSVVLEVTLTDGTRSYHAIQPR